MAMAFTQPIYQEQMSVPSSLDRFDMNCSMLAATNIASEATTVSSELSPPLSSSSSLSMTMQPMTTMTASTPDSDYIVDYGFPQIPISLAGVSFTDHTNATTSLESPITAVFPGICATQQPMATQLDLSATAAAVAANNCSGAPPTPIPTPTVPSLSKQTSPTVTKFPEFHEYNRLHYEISTDPEAKKRAKVQQQQHNQKDVTDRSSAAINAELRRQIHIQSEQKRRAQIKDGFEELRHHLPSCGGNKKISKSAILSKTVVFIQQLKHNQMTLLAELKRLNAENDRLKQCMFGSQSGQH